MFIKILGSAAGGGFPQWNCKCPNCKSYKSGDFNGSSRTQSSIAISKDQETWVIINTSPDLRHQILATPKLVSSNINRKTSILAVVLTDSQIDHSSGLLFLRENNTPINIYSTNTVKRHLTEEFPIIKIVDQYCGIVHNEISEEPFYINGLDNIKITPLSLVEKGPPYLGGTSTDKVDGNSIALHIQDEDSQKSFFYAPGIGKITEEISKAAFESDLILSDGTFFTINEMSTTGSGSKTALDMGHIPLSDYDDQKGLISWLDTFKNQRKVLIHINNTNPILDESSVQAQILKDHNIETSYDGMDLTL